MGGIMGKGKRTGSQGKPPKRGGKRKEYEEPKIPSKESGPTTHSSKCGNEYVNVPPPPPVRGSERGRQNYRAVFSYNACYPDDLSFRVGDRFEILGKSDGDEWWYAKHIKTTKTGYIPSNYVVIDDESDESQDWWHPVDRSIAMKQLLLPGNPVGTFLVRGSANGDKCLALSVLDREEAGERKLVVRHFLVRKMDDGHSVYVLSTEKFPSLKELIAYYSKSENSLRGKGLKVQLTKPCPKENVTRPLREIHVKQEDIVLGERLGGGYFGEVFAGKIRKVIDVAVKTMKPGAMLPDEFLEEAETMNRLRHPKLVQLLGVCMEPLYIITELMSNGCLLDYLRKDEGRTVKFPTLVDIAAQHVRHLALPRPHLTHLKLMKILELVLESRLMRAQVADGMSYLEKKNFMHRDLRAANILVGDNNAVKVADFGLSRLLDDIYEVKPDAKFPIRWTAPEAFGTDSAAGSFSIKSDVWSYGVLLYEIVTYGMNPYHDMPSTAEVKNRVSRGYRMASPHGKRLSHVVCECPPPLYNIMTECWNAEPAQRPTFEFLERYLNDYAVSSEGSYAEP